MQRRRFFRFLLSLWIGAIAAVLAPASTHAVVANRPLMLGTEERVALASAFTFLEDRDAQLSLDQVLQDSAQQRFAPFIPGSASTNFGVTHSAVWLRLDLKTEPNAPLVWLMEFSNPLLSHVDVYLSNSAGGFDVQRGGNAVPPQERSIKHRSHVFALHLPPGQVRTVYVRLASHGTVVVNGTLWRPEAFALHTQVSYSILSLYFGLLLGLFLYNLLLFFSIRDRVYLTYVGFVAAMALYQGALTGLGAQFIWPDSPWWNLHASHVGVTLCCSLGILFARDFLNSPQNMPRADKLMQWLVLAWALVLLVPLALSLDAPIRLHSLLAAISVITLLVVGTLGMLRGQRDAMFFLLAWAALFVGASVLGLLVNGIAASHPLAVYSLLIGSAMEMVLLSFALADRINAAREESREAKAANLAKHALVEALSQSQERYRAVIEQVGEGMLVTQDGHTVFANARAVEILRASKKEVLQSGLGAFVHPDDQALLAQRLQRKAAGEPTPPRYELRLTPQADGTVRWLEVGDATIPWDGGQAVLTFFQDQTQRKNAESETLAAIQRQQDLNDLRSRFVAMTSHEFRTPLAIILSSHDLLNDYGDKMPAADKRTVMDSIASGVRRMELMLDRVLLLGRADAGMLEFNPLPGDLTVLCRELEQEARALAQDSQCTLVADFHTDIGRTWFDEKLLRHIFSNLLSNAIKYSPNGGEVRFSVAPAGPDMVFEVSDQGIGIPADEIGNLFESFHRARNVGDIQGTGLGLAIVKNSVDLHGGTITVHSQPSVGTTFTVTIRVKAEQ